MGYPPPRSQGPPTAKARPQRKWLAKRDLHHVPEFVLLVSDWYVLRWQLRPMPVILGAEPNRIPTKDCGCSKMPVVGHRVRPVWVLVS